MNHSPYNSSPSWTNSILNPLFSIYNPPQAFILPPLYSGSCNSTLVYSSPHSLLVTLLIKSFSRIGLNLISITFVEIKLTFTSIDSYLDILPSGVIMISP